VTALPRTLARWESQLSLFGEETATTLGALIRRLAPTFDALPSIEQEPGGEPDGFDGIGRRGSYERLLASEWALQRYAPLEFLRRAASGEQAFFQLSRKQPATRSRTFVLFDAGPDQLGDCRIAQLALLVLLVQRAETHGHELTWQLLHRRAEGVHAGLDEAGVRSFLQGRTPTRSSPEAWAGWLDRVAEQQLWLVGSERVTACAPRAFARVALRQRLTTESIVDVGFDSGTLRRRVALSCPEPEQGARLLRDPFGSARARPVAIPSPGSDLLLSPRGNRLYYRDAKRQLVSLALPNSPRATAGAPKRYQSRGDEVFASVGGKGRKSVWLSRPPGGLRVTYYDGRTREQAFAGLPELDRRRLTPFVWFPSEEVALFESCDRELWRAELRTGSSYLVAEGVRSWLTVADHHFVAVDHWLEGEHERPCVLELSAFTDAAVAEAPAPWQDARLSCPPPGGDRYITLGHRTDLAWDLQCFALDEPKPWKWTRQTALFVPSNATLLGIEAYTAPHDRPGLWLLEGDRRQVSLARRSSARTVLSTSSPIEQATVASGASIVAVRTASEIIVAEEEGTVRYRGAAS
jgi:hypothetical protein